MDEYITYVTGKLPIIIGNNSLSYLPGRIKSMCFNACWFNVLCGTS